MDFNSDVCCVSSVLCPLSTVYNLENVNTKLYLRSAIEGQKKTCSEQMIDIQNTLHLLLFLELS